MSLKQKVNDKCLCGSGKKYKKCCINKQPISVVPKYITDVEKEENSVLIEETLKHKPNIEVLNNHTYLPPQTTDQLIFRNMLKPYHENIKEPHCEICGDTENDGKLFKIPTQISIIFMCEFCYNVQTQM